MPYEDYPPYPSTDSSQYPPDRYAGIPTPPHMMGGQYGDPWSSHLATMPGTVRTAQIIAWIMGALGIVLIGVAMAARGGEFAGQIAAGFLLPIGLSGCAFNFGSGKNGLRITAIVVASLQGLFSLGGMATMQPPGLLGIVTGVTIACLLAGKSAKQWFSRPRLI